MWFRKKGLEKLIIDEEHILKVMKGGYYTTEEILDLMYEDQGIEEENRNYNKDTPKLVRVLRRIRKVKKRDLYYVFNEKDSKSYS